MEKARLLIFAELSLGDTGNFSSKPASKFTGTDNPRHLRVIHALSARPRTREEIDRIAGSSNAPELIAELRRRGFRIPCKKAPGTDRDGYPIRFGVYEFDDDDRIKLAAWLRKRDAKGKS